MMPMILKIDTSGLPIRWVTWQEATVLYTRDLIAWTAGENTVTLSGGINRDSGIQSTLTLNSIIAIKGHHFRNPNKHLPPCLTNRALFYRDENLCMYCGKQFPSSLLTRDHVVPISRGGEDEWRNVVSSCQACNTRKGAKTPEEAHMQLVAIPFVPNHAEYLALCNRRILSDQMEFLRKQFRRNSRIRIN